MREDLLPIVAEPASGRYNLGCHGRRSIRKPGYDYAQPGVYFVTILAHRRAHLFGQIRDGVMHLSAYGRIAYAQWQRQARWGRPIWLDAFVVMPNHIHGILVITDTSPGVRPTEDDVYAILTHLGAHGGHRRGGTSEAGGMSPKVGTQHRGHRKGDASEAFPPTEVIQDTSGTITPIPHSRDASPLRDTPDGPTGTVPGSLGALVQAYKSITTRRINKHRSTPGASVWQRNYYDRILPDVRALHACRHYIHQNPARWATDRCNG